MAYELLKCLPYESAFGCATKNRALPDMWKIYSGL